jgi:hypothetical protein
VQAWQRGQDTAVTCHRRGQHIRFPLINSATSQYKQYFAYRSLSPIGPYRNNAHKTGLHRKIRYFAFFKYVFQILMEGVHFYDGRRQAAPRATGKL